MIKKTTTSFVAGAVMALTGQAALADAHSGEITVAYFLEWPMPMLAMPKRNPRNSNTTLMRSRRTTSIGWPKSPRSSTW